MTYLLLKYFHILSMVLLFGTGLGSAFYKWMADRSNNLEHINVTNRNVVLADWIFTTPAIIFQPVSGIWMLYLTGIPFSTFWVSGSLTLFLLAGACWIPVVWLQIRMKQISEFAIKHQTSLPEDYWKYSKIWFFLGIPAFISMILIVLLMVFKPT